MVFGAQVERNRYRLACRPRATGRDSGNNRARRVVSCHVERRNGRSTRLIAKLRLMSAPTSCGHAAELALVRVVLWALEIECLRVIFYKIKTLLAATRDNSSQFQRFARALTVSTRSPGPSLRRSEWVSYSVLSYLELLSLPRCLVQRTS